MVTRLLTEGSSSAFTSEGWSPSAAAPARLASPMPPFLRKSRREFSSVGRSLFSTTASCSGCFFLHHVFPPYPGIVYSRSQPAQQLESPTDHP